jgi:hypothetical protein
LIGAAADTAKELFDKKSPKGFPNQLFEDFERKHSTRWWRESNIPKRREKLHAVMNATAMQVFPSFQSADLELTSSGNETTF